MRFYIILIIFFSLQQTGVAQYAEEANGTYYLTVSVKYGLKSGNVTQKLLINIGEDKSHPLFGKANIIDEERISIGNLSDVRVFSNEVDVLHHLSKLGWEIESINTISILASEYKQYLMKIEVENQTED